MMTALRILGTLCAIGLALRAAAMPFNAGPRSAVWTAVLSGVFTVAAIWG